MGKQGEFLVKKLLKKIQRNLIQPVKFVVIYDTKKISYFLPKKDKIPNPSRTNIVYEFTCPGCNSSYVGKTERNLATRLSEHSDPQKSSISKHLSEYEHANYILNLNHIFDNLNDINDSDTNKPDTRYLFTISFKLTLKLFTLSNTRIPTSSYSLKLFILKEQCHISRIFFFPFFLPFYKLLMDSA